MTIGERIKARRVDMKLSQRELASRLGYNDHTTLTRIEAGKVDLTQSRIMQFAEVLGVTPGYLMGWEQEPEEFGALAAQVLKDPAAVKLVRDFLALSDTDRGTVASLVSSLASKKS